jgi:hypothetical protein
VPAPCPGSWVPLPVAAGRVWRGGAFLSRWPGRAIMIHSFPVTAMPVV